MMLLLPDDILEHIDHFDFVHGQYVPNEKATEEDIEALKEYEKQFEKMSQYKGIEIIEE